MSETKKFFLLDNRKLHESCEFKIVWDICISLIDDNGCIVNWDLYFRYIDDQVTHARIELVGSIFRSKHGPLLQRLRYTYRKGQRTSSSTFDDIFINSPFFPTNIIPSDNLLNAKPDKLIDEFFILNKQLQQQRNPNLGNLFLFILIYSSISNFHLY